MSLYAQGAGTSGEQKAVELISCYRTELTEIRYDPNLSPEGKVKRMAEAYIRTKDAVAVVRGEDTTSREDRIATLERGIFGTIGSAEPSAAISYRDAQDRVAAVDAQDERRALTMLRQAERSGDTYLAKAVLERAYSDGWQQVVEEYALAHPNVAKQMEELTQLHRAATNPAILLGSAFIYEVDKPSELDRYSNSSLRSLAERR